MQVVFFFTKLKEGVSSEDYEKWVQDVDYVKAGKVPSILSYQVYRIKDYFMESKIPKTYDYIEVIEVTDLESYRKDIQEDPNIKIILDEVGKYLDIEGNSWGVPVMPGLRKR